MARTTYYPYGGTRTTSGAQQTDRLFTDQRSESAALGALYDYGARHFDTLLGRFLSADSIVPGAGNPQALNRYAYGLNNPVRYNDPTGHACEEPTRAGGCGGAGYGNSGPGEYGRGRMPNPKPLDVAPAEQASATTRLYHGTDANAANNIRNNGIDLSKGRGNLDFDPEGKSGFYMTCNRTQAQEMASRVASRNSSSPDILEYDVPNQELGKLNGKTFNSADSEWGSAVTSGRQGTLQHDYDFVEGPVLKKPVGVLTRGEPPLPYPGYDQFAIYTEKAVELFDLYLLP